jgi:hypothetical protein
LDPVERLFEHRHFPKHVAGRVAFSRSFLSARNNRNEGDDDGEERSQSLRHW